MSIYASWGRAEVAPGVRRGRHASGHAIEPGVILETVRTGASGIGRGERILKI